MDTKHPPKSDPTEELERLRARVAELERTERRLRETAQESQALFLQAPIALVAYDADGRVTQANKASLELSEMPDLSPYQGYSFFESPDFPEGLKKALRRGEPARYQFDYDFAMVRDRNLYPTTRSDIMRVEALMMPILREGKEQPVGYLAQMQDVTERLRQEAQLGRLNRTLKARSRSSQVMLNATDELEYMQEVCRIIVEDCGYKLVWIGFAEEDEGKTVRPVAYSGFEEGYIEKLRITWADTERGRGPTGTAIRTGRPSSCKNVRTDPAVAPWRKDALERGYASLVALPLLSGGRAFGAITIYATEPEAFSEEETKLLCELADDLAFGITALRLRAAHKAADEELRESEEMFHTIFDKAPTGILLADLQGRMSEANPAFVEMLGYPLSELRGRNVFEITHPDDRPADQESVREQIAGGRTPADVEKRYVCKDGQIVFVRLIRTLCRDAGGKPQFFIGISEDITAGKQAEEALQTAYRELEQRVRDRTAELIKANEGLQAEIAERQRAEQALRESERTIRGLLNATSDEVFLLDAAGTILLANETGAKQWGKAAAELAGRCAFDFMEPALAEARKGRLAEAIQSGTAIRFEDEHHGRWYDNAVYPIRDGQGKTIQQAIFARDITDRKRMEGELRENEARLRAIFDNAPFDLWVRDSDGRCVAQNSTSLKHWGPQLGKRPEDSGQAGDVKELWQENNRRALAGAVVYGEAEYLQEGEACSYYNIIAPLRVGNEIRGTVGFNLDITERKRAEAALRESEERYRRLYESMMDAFVSAGMDGRIREFNQVYQRMLGYSDEELKRLTYMELTPARWHASEAKIVEEEVLPRGYSEVFEKEYRKKDGTVFPVELRTCLTRDAAGQPVAMWAVVRDITERKRAEEVLRESEERYRALFEDSPVAVVEYDCHGLMEYLNELKRQGISDVREHMGHHPEEADRCIATLIPLRANRAAVTLMKAADPDHLLKNLPSTLYDETREYLRMALSFLTSGKTSFESNTVLRTLTGEKREVWVSASFIPGRGNRHPRGLVAMADLTELHEAERELARQRQAAQLQRTETLAVTGRLAAGIAHEVNNPLQGIVAQLDLLSIELPAKLRKGRRMKLIRDSVEKIARIVQSLLCLHRPPQEDETSCSASSVIGGVTDLIFAQAMNRQVRVEVSITPPDATVPLSTVRLTQVLLNLILNALDATPSGGVIRIEANQTPKETLLLVNDTGSGIPPGHRSRLFSPFFTTKGPAGTGLGLSVTHSLIIEAGGTIDVADREGGGTTFFVRFPGRRDSRR
jgi:PAS domain S-box-containing protein